MQNYTIYFNFASLYIKFCYFYLPMQSDTQHTSPETKRNERKRKSPGLRIASQLIITLAIALVCTFLGSLLADTPKKAFIIRDGMRIDRKYDILHEKILLSENLLEEIRHRDHYVYRPLLGVDTLNIPQVYSDYPDSKYDNLDEELIETTYRKMDRLMRNIYYASLSLDDTQELAEHKEEFSTVIPAIWPIDRTKLKYVSSLYGMRMHPTYGTWRMHEGVDLSAPKGTSVYATGNGIVSQAEWRPGYGQVIEINHGFGYKTRYAHLSKMFVIEGDSVTRGEVIGEVGNTGTSSGAHLHYEVRYRNNTVNPIHYFNKDMTPESYIDLMEQLSKGK